MQSTVHGKEFWQVTVILYTTKCPPLDILPFCINGVKEEFKIKDKN